MHVSYLSAALAVVSGASALPSPQKDTLTIPITQLIPAIPVNIFAETPKFKEPVLPSVAKKIFEEKNKTAPETPIIGDLVKDLSDVLNPRALEARARCANPRVRMEWDSFPDSGKQAYIDAIKCLQSRPPSGQFRQSRSRYEDLAALHQTLTPNVHGNAKFLLWHRYYTWVFEDELRVQCGYNQAIPWFDETRYAGRFASSSIFNSRWYGGLAIGGRCVSDGVSSQSLVSQQASVH
jgi:tyrosinase